MRPTDITIDSILSSLNTIAPFSLAESWDNVGLMIGSLKAPVSGIMIGLDPTVELLDEAIALGANLVITHHPLIFPALKAIPTDQPTGALIAKAIGQRIALIACHTNLDVVVNGVSHCLAQGLGLTEIVPLASSPAGSDLGLGRVGNLVDPVSGPAFLSHLCRVIGVPALSVAGPLPDRVLRVAVCGGSGSELATAAEASGAEVFITAEVKHHIARWAEATGFCVVDAGHFATEQPIVRALAAMLAHRLASQELSIPVHVTERQKTPFSCFRAGNDQ